MCQAKHWRKIYSKEIENTPEATIIYMLAERSDLEIFNVELHLVTGDTKMSIATKIKKAFEALESYRNCDCFRENVCIKHISSIEINNAAFGQAKSEIRMGGR